MKVSFFQPLSIYHQGKREMQEDSIFPAMGQASELDNLFIVCDGMGGHEKGEVASSTVTEAISEYFFQNTSPEETLDDQVISGAIEFAYAKLMEKVDPNLDKKPGTTLCLLYFHRGGCTAAHIGDSRIYHIRPAEGKILYKSRDHSVVYELYTLGEITEQQMLTHPRKNIITKVIMPGSNSLKPDVAHIADIQSGDYFYVCSDGMLEKMLDKELIDIFSANITNEEKRDLLLEKTKDNADNHSAYIIQIDGVMHEQRDKDIIDDEIEMMKKSLPGAFAPVSAESVYEPEPPKPQTSSSAAPYTAPAPTPNPVPPVNPPSSDEHPEPSAQSNSSRTSDYSSSASSSPKKRSLVIPLLTTLVLLGALAFVLFKCNGEKAAVEDNPQVVEDTVKPKKPERDTFNIMGGGEAARSSDMPQPSGEKKAEEQKPTEKKDESKSEQPKQEGEGTTTSPSETTTTAPAGGTTNPSAGQTTAPQATTPAPTQQNPTPAPAQQQAPPPQQEGPKPVIPDGE